MEKCGFFKAEAHLIHILKGKRGLHLVVLYLVFGEFRVPWGFRVWRGKGTPSSAQLAVRLIDSLHQLLTQAFRVVILADTAFGSVLFLKAMLSAVMQSLSGSAMTANWLMGGNCVTCAARDNRSGSMATAFPVTISWLFLKRDGKLEKRFVLSTRPLKGSTITWWGRRRWSIEGFFKTVKHRFGCHRFGQQTLLGVYRWLLVCLISFVLTHWVYLSTGSSQLPDWGAASALALKTLRAEVVVCLLLLQVERTRLLLQSVGLDLQLVEVKT